MTKAQHAPASPWQASLALPRQCACTMAHWKKRQPNAAKSASSNSESTPIDGVGKNAHRQRVEAAIAAAGALRGSISERRTKRVVMEACELANEAGVGTRHA